MKAQPRKQPVTVVKVHPLVLAKAKEVQRPGERLELVDEHTVRLVPV